VTDTNAQLRDVADYVRTVAATAANEKPEDRLICWTTERIAGQERVIEFRQYSEGHDHNIVALPAEAGVAEHLAMWDPRAAEAVATLLDVIADPAVGAPSAVHQYAMRLAELLDENR
jgi:hypothetical protein